MMKRSAGRLIRSISLPAPLHSVFMDPWEHAVYAGASDGRIFELSLLGSRPETATSHAVPSSSEAAMAEGDVQCLQGHTQAVTCLCGTSNGHFLLSGTALHGSHALVAGCEHCLKFLSQRVAQHQL